jgi:5-methylcytosine-specific restriction protein A
MAPDESRTTVETFFATPDRLDTLRDLLQFVARETPTRERVVSWVQSNTDATSKEVITSNLAFFERITLLKSESGTYTLDSKGEAYAESGEPLVVYEGLSAAVDRFVEMARAIPAGDRTFSAIQSRLREAYPEFVLIERVVRGHLRWLEALGLLEQSGAAYQIPIEGGQFETDTLYSRWFIHDVFGGGRYRGISTPSEHSFVFLYTGESGEAYGYEDGFEADGTLLYTGEGKSGDMAMTGGNARIRDHSQRGDALHVFENTDLPWIVRYVGEYEYVEHWTESLSSERGTSREAIRFRLVPAGETDPSGGGGEELSPAELYERAAKHAAEADDERSRGEEPGVEARRAEQRQYSRSEEVRRYALRVADGTCQGCGEPAPFQDLRGDPYLEVHHLDQRSEGGSDHPDNVIALCPNCHERIHNGSDGGVFNEELRKRAAALRAEFGVEKE